MMPSNIPCVRGRDGRSPEENRRRSGRLRTISGVSETATLLQQQTAVTAFATADLQADSPAEEQLFDANAGTRSALEPVPDPEPVLRTDQEQPMAADSRFSRFTALLKDCLDDVGRIVDREDSTSSAIRPSSSPLCSTIHQACSSFRSPSSSSLVGSCR